jgi:LysR family transcriptional regulator, transcriptional activator of nhaA
MEWLNYHHLLYFWTVAREGSVARACRELNLAQQTISGQIQALEAALGEPLFIRTGRNLALTDIGRTVYRYADEIFALGRELLDTVKDRPTGRPVRLTVGVSDALPRQIAYRLLEPAFALPEPVQVICREDKSDRLLAALALYELDVVLSDVPLGPAARVKAFSHLLGECGVTFFATAALAARHRKGFPGSLAGAPVLLPTDNTALRRSLDEWFDGRGIHPRVVAEVEDDALLKTFGQAGIGLFAAPGATEGEVRRQYHVAVVGRAADLRQRFYAISVERKLRHPAVVAISETARARLFG